MKPIIVTIEAIIAVDDDPIEFCEILVEEEVVEIFVELDDIVVVDEEVVFGWSDWFVVGKLVVDIVVTIGVTVVGFGTFDHFAIPFAVSIVPAAWKPPPTNKLFDVVSKYITFTAPSTPFCIKS